MQHATYLQLQPAYDFYFKYEISALSLVFQNSTSWRCFTFSKSSVAEGMEHPAGNGTAPSVVNCVLHASNGDVSAIYGLVKMGVVRCVYLYRC